MLGSNSLLKGMEEDLDWGTCHLGPEVWARGKNREAASVNDWRGCLVFDRFRGNAHGLVIMPSSKLQELRWHHEGRDGPCRLPVLHYGQRRVFLDPSALPFAPQTRMNEACARKGNLRSVRPLKPCIKARKRIFVSKEKCGGPYHGVCRAGVWLICEHLLACHPYD